MGCGNNLTNYLEQLVRIGQFIDIHTISLKYKAHEFYEKQCSCGNATASFYPQHVAYTVQYVFNVESLVAYIPARQYLPNEGTKKFINDAMGFSVSTGNINNILKRFVQKAVLIYDAKKRKNKVSYLHREPMNQVKILTGKTIWYGYSKIKR